MTENDLALLLLALGTAVGAGAIAALAIYLKRAFTTVVWGFVSLLLDGAAQGMR